jgi:hypothetical protein
MASLYQNPCHFTVSFDYFIVGIIKKSGPISPQYSPIKQLHKSKITSKTNILNGLNCLTVKTESTQTTVNLLHRFSSYLCE